MIDRVRNALAHAIANAALNHLATPEYRDELRLIIRLGEEAFFRAASAQVAVPAAWSQAFGQQDGSNN